MADDLLKLERLIADEGSCEGLWDCDECPIYELLVERHGGDCLTEYAYDAALEIRDDLLQCGRCTSIW